MPDLVGQVLSERYRIVDRIGSGAMGDVYRGWDNRLGKDVAIKVITARLVDSEWARRDLQDEARKLARIQNPHVAAVYDFHHEGDLDYLVLEYVPGVTLNELVKAGPLPEQRVVELGIQLADGMKAAHDRGIVHSDLKPANVRVQDDGTLKILDFGIARTLKDNPDATSTHDPDIVRGTLPYMAPEHLRGEAPDVRSDLYAAGVMLFELATSKRPFADVNAAISTPPPSPRTLNSAISPKLETIVLRCLEKAPQDRFTSAEDLKEALMGGPLPQPIPEVHGRNATSSFEKLVEILVDGWLKKRPMQVAAMGLVVASLVFFYPRASRVIEWIRKHQSIPTATVEVVKLGVLPFRTAGVPAERDYLGDGFVEELSVRLGRLDYDKLRIVGFPATSRYKSDDKTGLDEIRKTLGVSYLLDGSLVTDGSNLKVIVRLTDEKGAQRWANSFHEQLDDVLAIQARIADSVAVALAVELRGNPHAQPVDLDRSTTGQDRYFRGLSALNRDDLVAARADFEAAINSDPSESDFHGELAQTWIRLENAGLEASEVAMPRALTEARSALTLDSSSAIGHVALAQVYQDYDRRWVDAEDEYRRAVDLDPSSPSIREAYASLLLITGSPDSARKQLEAAFEMDSLSLAIPMSLGAYHYLTGAYDAALAQTNRAVSLYPQVAKAHYQKAITLLALQRQSEAIESFATSMRLDGASDADVAAMRASVQHGGVQGYWKWMLARLVARAESSYVSSFELARAYAAIGDQEHAFELLNHSADIRESVLAAVVVDPIFAPMRKTPRYALILKRLGLDTMLPGS